LLPEIYSALLAASKAALVDATFESSTDYRLGRMGITVDRHLPCESTA
jgi:hypothetical protein